MGNVRKTLDLILVSVLPLFLLSCKKDNYSAPNIHLKGNIVYNGENINVSYNDVTFQLWEPGWGKLTPINVTVNQDGSYSALLFKGKYKLVFPPGAGPFIPEKDKNSGNDTIYIDLQTDMNLDINVTPYYLIKNSQFSFTSTDSTVHAKFKIQKIISDSLISQGVESVTLYISKTNWVDGRTSIASSTISGSSIVDTNNVSLSVRIPSMVPVQHYVFARIGLKITNIGKMIFSPIEEIDF